VIAPTDYTEIDILQVDAATSAAPEPGAWALMIGGLAMIGAMLRLGRRRTVMAVA
jgi:hypothetical protein